MLPTLYTYVYSSQSNLNISCDISFVLNEACLLPSLLGQTDFDLHLVSLDNPTDAT